MTPFEILTFIKETLATIPNVATCTIGIEANVTPADYPLIRIVPTRLRPRDDIGDLVVVELTIYFGAALLEAADGLETVYAGLLALEEAIRQGVLFGSTLAAWNAGSRLTGRHIDTVFDEDRLPHYKMMASRFEVEG